MARISKYTKDNTVEKTDKFLGSDSSGATKNYIIEDVSRFFKNTNAVGVVGHFTYQYKSTSPFGAGSMRVTFSTGLTFEKAASIKISKFTYGATTSSESILAILSGKDVIIVDVENQNNFGIYTAGTPTQDGSTDFYDISLSGVQNSNGSFTSEKIYAIIAYGGGGGDKTYTHEQSSGAATWEVEHDLGKRPSVTVVDVNNVQGYGIVTHTNANELTITFPGSTTGKAYCN
jgi:hypothetical protein